MDDWGRSVSQLNASSGHVRGLGRPIGRSPEPADLKYLAEIENWQDFRFKPKTTFETSDRQSGIAVLFTDELIPVVGELAANLRDAASRHLELLRGVSRSIAHRKVLRNPTLTVRKQFEPSTEVDAACGKIRGRGVPTLSKKLTTALLWVIPALVDVVVPIEPRHSHMLRSCSQTT